MFLYDWYINILKVLNNYLLIFITDNLNNRIYDTFYEGLTLSAIINQNNIYGFQFHPESFLTENGDIIIKIILSS